MDNLQTVWNWQPALYLFLGGMGAGAFIAAAVLFFIDKDGHKKTISTSIWAAAACIIVGLVLLLTELIFPLRGLLLWQSFSNFSSWMAIGAWVLFAAVIIFVIAGLLTTDKIMGIFFKKDSALKALALPTLIVLVVGAVLALGVAAYTGILLMSAPGIPLWNTWLLPCLFTVSALDTGIALVVVVSAIHAKKEKMSSKVHKLSELAVMALVVLELIVLAVFIVVMLSGNGSSGSAATTATESIKILLQGTLAPLFWGLFIVIGLVVPLAAAVLVTFVHKAPKEGDDAKKGVNFSLIGAIGALVGGCTLRFLIVLAGLHANYVTDAVEQILTRL